MHQKKNLEQNKKKIDNNKKNKQWQVIQIRRQKQLKKTNSCIRKLKKMLKVIIEFVKSTT